jgi:prepilin-type N-terminal cleavage/methylation domain-containing protein
MTRRRFQNVARRPSGARPARRRAYSLIETLIAAAIVAIGIGAAAMLAMTMISQQEISAKVVRALNYQEQACRMYQLGVSPAVITNFLPPESAVTSLVFTTNSVSITNVGTVEMGVCTAVFAPGSRFGANSTRTNINAVVRPTIR